MSRRSLTSWYVSNFTAFGQGFHFHIQNLCGRYLYQNLYSRWAAGCMWQVRCFAPQLRAAAAARAAGPTITWTAVCGSTAPVDSACFMPGVPSHFALTADNRLFRFAGGLLPGVAGSGLRRGLADGRGPRRLDSPLCFHLCIPGYQCQAVRCARAREVEKFPA